MGQVVALQSYDVRNPPPSPLNGGGGGGGEQLLQGVDRWQETGKSDLRQYLVIQ